jgi:hypothetical protein
MLDWTITGTAPGGDFTGAHAASPATSQDGQEG